MPANFDDAFARVKQLAADFKANEKFYLSPQYQEAEARRDYIDKFLIALGWDVNHETQKNPYEQEVKVERKEHGVSQRRADYAFYLAPNFRDVKFYIEAKKPFGDIATPDNYFQTIRYGWNSKTPIAALFDFEQFEIVDCRFKPDLETALQRNLKKFHYSQYADKEKFAEIYWLFSREAVANSSLEKYAEALPKKRGTAKRGLLKGSYQSIDEAFLEELDAHRDALAHIFKNHNPKLDGETLTEVTQRTLDRLVFIRFLEDKQIEPQYLVSKFGERSSVWGDFIATSRRLDGIYNGIVFKKNEVLDSPNFKVDNDQFGEICEALAHINSPYDFNAIPIHILGSIYERFLGKVIVATDKRARVEEKPEVRKAGGVYYTPEYIVRYIVENTVGKLIEGKTPVQIAKMRFADIACGSGSFLLGIYDLLLRYHTKFYNENPGKAKKDDVMQRDDGLHLSLQKKREILVNNIYGVDIDAQAVEVAQLSLYLKLLQDETPGSTRQYFLDFEQQALLPSLAKNIVCGNSLIGTDILSGELFEPVAERKLNPMNFEDRFPEIMKRGGFDAVIGNPPYVLGRETFDDSVKDYLGEHYSSYKGKFDLYVYFTERAIRLLKEKGRLGYILPNTLLVNENATLLRKFILDNSTLDILRVFSSMVFKGAQVESVVSILKKEQSKNNSLLSVESETTTKIPQAFFLKRPFFRFDLSSDSKTEQVLTKLAEVSTPLRRLSDICIGIQLGGSAGEKTKEFFISEKKTDACFKKVLDGKEINTYQKSWRGNYVRYGDWLHRKRNEKYFLNPKIMIRQIGATPVATVDEDNFYTLNTIYNLITTTDYSVKFFLAIINSTLGKWFWRKQNSDYKTLFPKIKKTQIESIPIPKINFKLENKRRSYDRMISLVEQMLAAKQQLAGVQSDKDKDFYGNKCAALDRQIDALVYELYALTPDEIKIVEGSP